VPLSTGGGILSTIAVRLVRLVRSGWPGFVPFLFPGFMSASEATDVGRMTVVSVDTAQHGAIGILRASGPHEHTLEAPLRSHVLVTEELHRHGDQPAGYTQPRLSPRLPPTAVPPHVRPRRGQPR